MSAFSTTFPASTERRLTVRERTQEEIYNDARGLT